MSKSSSEPHLLEALKEISEQSLKLSLQNVLCLSKFIFFLPTEQKKRSLSIMLKA